MAAVYSVGILWQQRQLTAYYASDISKHRYTGQLRNKTNNITFWTRSIIIIIVVVVVVVVEWHVLVEHDSLHKLTPPGTLRRSLMRRVEV